MKVAILGTGGMGRNVIRHLLEYSEPLELHAYDCNPEALDRARTDYGIVPLGLDAIMADRAIELVFITTANHAHKDLAIAALNAGKSVMCEKPMAITVDDAREMVETAERLGRYLQIGFELRYSTLYTKVKQWIDQGRLGVVRHIQCTYICSEFYGKNSWRVRLDTGGSLFGEKLSHYVDLPRWWIGQPIKDVYTATSPNVVPYFETSDNYQTTVRYEGGAVSHLTFMMAFASTGHGDPLIDLLDQQKDDGHELRFKVMGTEGGIETDVFRRQLKRWEYEVTDEGFRCRLVETITWKPEEDHAYFHNTRDQAHDVVRRVAQGLPPSTPARDAFESTLLCYAADLSLQEERLVRLSEVE